MNQISKLREISVEERWPRRPSCPLAPCSEWGRMFGSSKGEIGAWSLRIDGTVPQY